MAVPNHLSYFGFGPQHIAVDDVVALRRLRQQREELGHARIKPVWIADGFRRLVNGLLKRFQRA